MPTKRISDLMAERTRHSAQRVELWDTLCPGLGLRVGLRKKVWVLMHRHKGRAQRLTLGTFPAMGVAEARQKADAWRELLARGEDPREVEENARKAAAAARQDTVAKHIETYLARHAKPKQKSWRDTERRLKIMAAALGKRPIGSVTRRDIIELIDSQVERGLTTGANRLLAHVRKFFNWCVERDAIPASPAAGISAPHAEVPRDRVLSDDEIRALWAAAGDLGYPFGHAFRMLLLTGQRVGETSAALWEHVDLEERVWHIPPAANKSGRPHWVPLGPMAVELLQDCERLGDWAFTSTGRRPAAGWARIKERLDDLTGVDGWVLHDVRRTFATRLAALGVPRHITENLLSHAPKGADRLAAIYQRHDFAEEKRLAVEAWERKLQQILGLSDETNVIGLNEFREEGHRTAK